MKFNIYAIKVLNSVTHKMYNFFLNFIHPPFKLNALIQVAFKNKEFIIVSMHKHHIKMIILSTHLYSFEIDKMLN